MKLNIVGKQIQIADSSMLLFTGQLFPDNRPARFMATRLPIRRKIFREKDVDEKLGLERLSDRIRDEANKKVKVLRTDAQPPYRLAIHG